MLPFALLLRRSWLARAVAALVVMAMASAPAHSSDELTDGQVIGFVVALGLVLGNSVGGFRTATNSKSGILRLSNIGATLEPDEPTFGGRMQKTIWGTVTLPRNQRVVIHTFGSDFDTALAVYTGPETDSLTRIVANDNTPVTGVSAVHSLVQFDAEANTRYSIQFGSKTGDEGDVLIGVSVFPPSGGLSAFLESVGTTEMRGQDFRCGYGEIELAACQNPRFVLHNTTEKTLTVTASSDLGPGVTPPPPFTLEPGEVATARFKFTASFDTTTVRTVSGRFTFVGSEGATTVARAEQPALIVVGGPGLGNALRAAVNPVVRAGYVNEPLPFEVTLTNNGAQAALGCHARTAIGTFVRTDWRRIDPVTGDDIGPQNPSATIPAGQSRAWRVTLRSQQSRVADPEFPLPLMIDCANTDPAPIDLRNGIDVSTLGVYRPRAVDVEQLQPAGETLNVPTSGAAKFRVAVVNHRAPALLRAIPVYLRPFEECCDPDKQFQVEICRTATATSACLEAASTEVEYITATGKPAYFTVLVRAPVVDPGFAPGKRRVFVKIWQEAPVDVATFDAVVAAESVAVRAD